MVIPGLFGHFGPFPFIESARAYVSFSTALQEISMIGKLYQILQSHLDCSSFTITFNHI
jgi:hypothetical protein